MPSSKGVRLSEEGEHLLPYINQVISACDALRSEAEVQGELYGRALTIGCFASIARARLPELQQTIPAAIDLQIAQDRSPTSPSRTAAPFW